MKWNSASTSQMQFQKSKSGTARAHLYYFVFKYGKEYAVGYYGYGEQIQMRSAGTFPTAQEARAFCEKYDNEALIIEEMTA